MTFNLQNIVKNKTLTTGLINLAFVIALFCSSDVVWHAESRLPEVAQTELAISDSNVSLDDNSFQLSFNNVTANSDDVINVSQDVFYVEQQHSRIIHTKFCNLTTKRNLFTTVRFSPIRLYPTEKSDTHSLNA